MIEAHPSDLPLLGPQAFAHYLPAYLLYALDHFGHENLVTEMTIYALTPNVTSETNENTREYFCDRLKPFTEEQIAAVEAFLLLVEADETFRKYLGDLGPGRRRLRALWEARWES